MAEEEDDDEEVRRGFPEFAFLERARPVTTDVVDGRRSRSLLRSGGDGTASRVREEANVGTPLPDDRLRALLADRCGDIGAYLGEEAGGEGRGGGRDKLGAGYGNRRRP